MIRIDSDTHFTSMFLRVDLKYAEQGPRVVALPIGRYRIDKRRAPHVPAHIKPLRVNGRPKFDFESSSDSRRWHNRQRFPSSARHVSKHHCDVKNPLRSELARLR